MNRLLLATSVAALAALPALADDRLFVSGRDAFVAYDLATGREIARIATPGVSADLMALPSGQLVLNHRDGNAVVVVDARSFAELARFPSSTLGGTRPVHSYLSPEIGGRRFVVIMNDGDEARTAPGTAATDSTALFIDATPYSPTFLQSVGEIPPGHRAPQADLRPGPGPRRGVQYRRLRRRAAGDRLRRSRHHPHRRHTRRRGHRA